MPTPSEHRTVQARILEYAEDIGWAVVPREEAERRRGFDPEVPSADRAKNRSLFFDDLLDVKVREFNPRYAEAGGALRGQFRHLHSDIYGNREFVEHLRNRGKSPDHEEKRERDLILIDYDDPAKNDCEVTQKRVFHNCPKSIKQEK
jgi:type I restriction enzyme, R subunit